MNGKTFSVLIITNCSVGSIPIRYYLYLMDKCFLSLLQFAKVSPIVLQAINLKHDSFIHTHTRRSQGSSTQ